MKTNQHKATIALLAGSLASTAHGAAVALYDFSTGRGIATAQNFINTGVVGVDPGDPVTAVTDGILGDANGSGSTVTGGTPFSIGNGLNLTIDSTAGAFTYGGSPWTGDPDVNLMGDAWLFNGLGSTGRKNFTLDGLSSLLNSSTTYNIIFLGSYTGGEFTKFENVTYDGINLGTIDTNQIVQSGGLVANVGDMANASFSFVTGSTIADELTFSLGWADAGTGNAAGIQGIALVQIPEPSSALLAGVGLLALGASRRRHS